LTVTFDELGNLQGQTITNQFAAFGDGVTFSPINWDNATMGQAGSTGFSGGDLENSSGGSRNVTMTFATPVSAAVFAAVNQGDAFTLTALLNGIPVDSFTQTIPSNPGIGFIGFTNDVFNQITVIPAAGSALSIDNLELNPAPEPATLTLLAVGVAALGLVRRCKAA
jgi:PEP-CTERM motif